MDGLHHSLKGVSSPMLGLCSHGWDQAGPGPNVSPAQRGPGLLHLGFSFQAVGVIVPVPDFSSGTEPVALASTDGDWPIRSVVEAGAFCFQLSPRIMLSSLVLGFSLPAEPSLPRLRPPHRDMGPGLHLPHLISLTPPSVNSAKCPKRSIPQ
jgi:hypothetical protein